MSEGVPSFDDPGLVEFFSANRSRPDDLYPSERRFLPWLARASSSVLDVGCAAGGFADIWRWFNAGIDYTGSDISSALVDAARRLRPDCSFVVGDAAAGLDLPDACADVVQALGWLHWEPRYPAAVRELWRLTERRLFFDVRLQDAGATDQLGTQATNYGGLVTRTPYIAAAWPAFAAMLLDLAPARILAHGYLGAPAADVEGIPGDVCFATFVVEKGFPDGEDASSVCLDLPFDWPAELGSRVRILQPERLDGLAPREGDER